MSEQVPPPPNTQSELEWVGSRLQKTREDIHERNTENAKIIEVGLIAEQVLAGAVPPSKKIVDLYELPGTQLTLELKEDLQTAVDQKERAFEAMIEDNLRWVLNLANKNRFKDRGLTPGDLFNEGYFGLLRGIEKYDYKRATFSTYSGQWIAQSMTKALFAKGRLIRLPGNIEEAKVSIRLAREVLSVEFKREPTLAELAAHLDKTPEAIVTALRAEKTIESLDQPVREDGVPLSELIEDGTVSYAFGGMEEVVVDREELISLLRAVTIDIDQIMARVPEGRRRSVRKAHMAEHLTEDEFELLVRHYGLLDGKPKTLAALAEEDGVTAQRLSYLHSRIQKKLQRILPPIAAKMGVYR